ncbi:TPA: polysaccharide pyruvyl transferase family protein [Raoultella ornithinolytica]|nr:polysaccharide pyruvyl transferase family protein [Raoultella ornithinolytica]
MFFKKSKNQELKKNLFWWEPADGKTQNAGDHLSRVIVERMLDLYDKQLDEKLSKKNKLLAIGSVMHFAKDADTIWGTGINGKVPDNTHKFQKLDVRAVRGPLTKNYLEKKGIKCPSVYGDPGLLLPFFYAEELLSENGRVNDFMIIPHMNESLESYSKFKGKIIHPCQGAISFTREILSSKFIVSSSLHGIIIAEAYGIPAVCLQNKSGEAEFKYQDYYMGSGRDAFPIATTIEEGLEMIPAELPDVKNIGGNLMKSFPYDLWIEK